MINKQDISETAILIFANSPEVEAKMKRFQPGSRKQSRMIARLLLRRTIREARKTGHSVHLIQESDQRGSNFQTRLANAVETIWKKGYSKQLIIGSDAPELDHLLLRRAASELESGDWVLGPAKDGGTYVIGLKRNVYSRHTFISLPWQTKMLFCRLARSLNEISHQGAYLPVVSDVDSSQDLRLIISERSLSQSFNKRLQGLITTQSDFPEYISDNPGEEAIPFQSLRAPPVCFT